MLIPLVAALVLLMVALAYMLGQLFSNVHLSMWAKDELYQLVLSLAMIALIVAIFQGLCAFTSAETLSLASTSMFPGVSNPFSLAEQHLEWLATAQGMAASESLMKSSLHDQYEATAFLYIGYPPPFGGQSGAFNANYKARAQYKDMLLNFLMPSIISLRLQGIALHLIEVYTISLLLPLALLLRMFPFTRTMGNFLIALSLACYTLLPLLYALFAVTAYSHFALILSGTINPIFTDPLVSEFATVALIIPQAVFLPNIAIVLLVTFTQALVKGLNAIAG